MITKKELSDFINQFQIFEKGIEKLSEAFSGNKYSCIMESDWCEAVGKMLDTFVDSHFTEEGADLVFYYIFEENKKVYSNNKEYSFDTIDDLWKILTEDVKLYFKNV